MSVAASATSAPDSTLGSMTPVRPGHAAATTSAARKGLLTRTKTSAPPHPARAIASLRLERASPLCACGTPSSRSRVIASALYRQAFSTNCCTVMGTIKFERRTNPCTSLLPSAVLPPSFAPQLRLCPHCVRHTGLPTRAVLRHGAPHIHRSRGRQSLQKLCRRAEARGSALSPDWHQSLHPQSV